MLFSSITFICFFLPFVLLGNYLLSFSRGAQNVFLLAVSLLFYAWGEPVYVFLMVASIAINYFVSMGIAWFDSDEKKKKGWLILGIIINLGILFVFKYAGFAVSNINFFLPGNELPVPKMALPIGISFFTFQAISYIVDVYRHDAKAEKNPLYLGLYIAFFPQLIAGPIVRYKTIAEEIRHRVITWRKFGAGCSRFVMGFCKKILLANQFAVLADYVFEMTARGAQIPILEAWLGAAAYMLQIFFDFSAYSDMAIGLGLMFGFRFEENFNYPYVALSVSEFWRRWHISLTTWFREYVYFPLGGSRMKNQDKIIRNLFVVWFLTGVWHGAEWTFILWGIWNFLFIFAERLFDFESLRVPAWCKHIYTLWVVLMGWVLFRAPNMEQAVLYIGNMYGMTDAGWQNGRELMLLREYWIYWLVGILLCSPFAKQLEKRIVNAKRSVAAVVSSVLYPLGLLALFILGFTNLVRGSYNPFIYFNF